MNANTSTDDNPSDAQMAQALEWFHRRISSFISLDDAQRDHCATIEEALLNYQAPSVRTVSRDAIVGTSEHDIRYEECLKVVQSRGFDTIADLIEAWDKLQQLTNPELEQARAALAKVIRDCNIEGYCIDFPAMNFIREHGPTILAALDRAK